MNATTILPADEMARIVKHLHRGDIVNAFVRDADDAETLRLELRYLGLDTTTLITFLERRSVRR